MRFFNKLCFVCINRKYSEGGKRTIFLVNQVCLAKQQCETIQNQITFNVELLIGEKGVDFWRKSDWDKLLDESEVLVSTADVINTALDHSYIDINKINLIIFDECHHGRKEHAYAKIMKKISPDSKIRIIGLSGMLVGMDGKIKASKVEDELLNLEAMFMSTVVTVESIQDFFHARECSTKAKEKCLVYDLTPKDYSTEKVQHLMNELKCFLSKVNLEKYSGSTNPKTLRPMTARKIKYLESMIEDFKYHVNEMGSFGGILSLMSSLIQLEITKRFSETNQYRKIVEVCITSFERGIKSMKTDLNLMEFTQEGIFMNSSNKVKQLIKLLMKFFQDSKDKNFQAIVFVKRRLTAKIIYHILKAIKLNDPNFPINADFVVGVNDDIPESIENIVNTSFTHLAIEKFKRKETNCIIATSVLEEGIDLQMCNFVVVYDEPTTYREYVQGKGRARSDESDYVVIVESSKKDDFNKKVLNWKEVSETLNRNLVMKTCDRQAPNEEEIGNQRVDLWEPFITPISKSILSSNNAVIILENYASKLPKDLFTSTNLTWNRQDLGDGLVVATVQLPPQSKLNQKVSSDPQKHVKIAKRHAAFKACKLLYEAGELDDNLVPISYEKKIEYCHDEYFTHWDKYSNDGKKSGTRKHQRYHEISNPKVLENSNPVVEKIIFLHRIQVTSKFKPENFADEVFHEFIGNDRTYGILSSKRLPQLCKLRLFQTFGEIQVEIHSPPEAITIPNDEKLKKLQQFHVTIFQDILRNWKPFMAFDHQSFIFVPLIDDKINWNLVENAQRVEQPRELKYDEIKRTDFSYSAYEHMVLCPVYRSTDTTYAVIRFIDDLTPKSEFPGEGYETYQQYYEQKWDKKIVCQNQNLVEVKGINKNLNIFFPGGGVSGKKKSYDRNYNTENFIPEICHNYKIPADYWLKATFLPSIFHRIHYLLLAEELRQRLKDEGIGNGSYNEQNLILDVDYGDYDNREKLINLLSDRDIKIDEEYLKKLLEILAEAQANKTSGILNERVNSKLLLYFDKTKLPIDIDRNWLTMKECDIDHYYKFLNEHVNFSKSIPNLKRKHVQNSTALMNQMTITDSIDRSKIKLLNINEYSQTIQQKDLIKVLTTSKAGDVFDMERLEVLGDAFLKFSVSLYLFKKHADWHEGYLTTLKGRIVSNRNLFYIGNDFGLSGMIKSLQFDAKSSLCPASKLPDDYHTKFKNNKELLECLFNVSKEPTRNEVFSGEITIPIDGQSHSVDENDDEKTDSGMLTYINVHRVGDKIIADAVEALIGVVVDSLGVPSGFKLLKVLKILPSDGYIDNLLTEKIEPRNVFETDPSIPNRAKLEDTIGYEFKNPVYLMQALTHPSFPVKTFGTYQQLEFIGDAVLDFLVTSYIIENCQKMDPGDLTDLRSALVNNATLACIIVRNNIHLYLQSESIKLTEVINKFVEYQRSKNHVVALDQIALLETEDDQNIAESVDIPKIIGDIFESIIG